MAAPGKNARHPVPRSEVLRTAIEKIAPSYDIDKVWLFGSCARGEQREGSDVDLCLETGSRFSLFDAGGFADDVQRALGGVPVDVVTEQSVYPHVAAGLRRDRRLVYAR